MKTPRKIGPAWALPGALSLLAYSLSAAPDPVQWHRDIRPLLSDNCFACHGADNNARKAGLRLDTKEGLFDGTPKREAAVVPGNLAKSTLWQRVITQDPDDLMPPPESHKTLKPAQKELLKKWILAGAPWQGHWAFIKPERPALPDASRLKGLPGSFPIRNPIDAFVGAKLRANGLNPNSEADRRTLARRVALDLTGLPPKPEEVEAFVNDRAPNAYDKLVARLLASPHWGEHRARYWLDAARYADTHGLHFDNYREMWPYRDWVIQAFNSNMRFNVFTLKQIAGDLLPSPTRDDLVATGFHRCNMTTNEGGTIDEENEANYANDRVTTTSWVWLGLTANCAACHDHKFDPITQKDFYSMEAFFRNTEQPPKDGNSKDSRPNILVPQSPADIARWDALPAELAAAQKQVDERRAAARPDFTNWLGKTTPQELAKDIPSRGLALHVPLNEKNTNAVPTAAGKVASLPVAKDAEWSDGELGPALVLKKDATLSLGDQGDFEKTNAFSYGAWVRVSKAAGNAAILARMDSANAFRGWDLYQNDRKFSVHIVNNWPEDALKVSTRNDVVKEKAWQHVFVTYDGSGKAKGVKLFIDGTEVPVKAEKDALKGSIRTPIPLLVGQRSKDHVLERGRVQDVRVYNRKLAEKEVSSLASAVRIQSFLALPANQRTKAQEDSVFNYWVSSRDPLYLERTRQQAALKAEQDAIRERSPVTHIQREKTNSMPMARILFRGQYDKPQDKVTPATFASLPPLPQDAPRNRLGLGQWLTQPDNPLTARVTVNRFWAEVFGTGLVKTAEDFGLAGEMPANQELLDWLAVEFQQSGWDVKHLFTLMVTSSAYRQSAEVTAAKLEKDPQNRLLSRGPRFRMDAEMVRDYALAASGLLVPKLGGASVKPYQPDGVWEPVAMPESNTKKYKRDSGEALYRRSLYTFWKRAAPPATMDIFNAPSREVCTVRRERTNTPLQALVTLNDPQFVEAARVLAERALARARKPEEALEIMGEQVLLRPLTSREADIVRRTWKDMQSFFEQDPAAAKELLATGESKPAGDLPAPQLAALTLVANKLMNLDEVLNK
jgi:mono/diheme cytochrome c family protein